MDKTLKGLVTIIYSICALLSIVLVNKQAFAADGGGYAVTGQISGLGYASQIYDETNGLPTSDANYILGSKDGSIWIGGYSGIIRYDGMEFERLDTSNGLTSARGMFQDSKGRIWIGTNDNGVVVIDKDKQIHLTYNEGLPSASIRSFAEDEKGNVYIGTTSGVCYADKKMKIFPIYDERVMNERVLKLEKGLDGTIYGQTKSGGIFSINNGLLENYYQSDELGIDLITTFIVSPDKEDYLYIGTEKGNVYYGKFGAARNSMEAFRIEEDMNIHWMSYDCGRIWISSSDKVGYLDEKRVFNEIKNLPMNSSIEMMTSDYQGNMWFASSTQGVMKVVTSNFENLSFDAEMNPEVVNTTCIFNNNLYIGLDTGLSIIDKENATIDNSLTEYLEDTRIRCIMADNQGNLWFSTFTNDLGLVCYDSKKNIKKYTINDGMPSNEVRSTALASDGSILVATNGGLAIIKDGKIVNTIDGTSGIRNTVFLTVQEGENGTIYVGTDGDGIYQINGSDIKKIGMDVGLTSEVVMRIKKDKKRNIYWIITSNSIEYLKDGKIHNIKSFPFNNNYEVHFDNKDELWIISSYGIYRVKIKDMLEDKVKEYELYTIANGLPSTPTANSFSDIDELGNLYMAGRMGVTKVNINNYFELTDKVKMGLSYIKCGKERIEPDGQGKYTIPADDGRIQIMPAVMDYTMANPTIKVFLEGREGEGLVAQKNKLSALEYTGLAYGDYILHIQMINDADGKIIQDEKFNITKKPQFYELFAIKVLIVIIFAVLAGFIVWRVMTGTVIRRQYEEIRKAKQEVENANKAKARFLSNMSYEIRSPINTIMGMNEMILREDAIGVPNEYFMSIINYAYDIKNASQSLLGFVDDLLDMSNIEEGKMKLNEKEYDSLEEMHDIERLIKSICFAKDFNFSLDIDESIPKRLYGDSEKIKQVIIKMVNNAMKNTKIGDFVLKIFVEEKTNEKCKLKFSIKVCNLLEKEKLDKNESTYDIIVKLTELLNGQVWENRDASKEKESEHILLLEQKIIDREGIGIYQERDEIQRGQYMPRFIAPDAEVLLVDNDNLNLDIIKGLLKATKMFITTAQNTEECLEKIKYGNFNVVFVDQVINIESEKDIVARIREINENIPIYLITTNAIEGEDYYKKEGYNGYITKPVDSRLLEKIIIKHIPEDMRMDEEDMKANQSQDIPKYLSWLKDVKGLDVREGIRVAGNANAYIFAINLFYDTIDNNLQLLRNAYDEEDIRGLVMRLHVLETSSYIIGANDLAKLSKKIGTICKRKELDKLDKEINDLLDQYTCFKEKLSGLSKEK